MATLNLQVSASADDGQQSSITDNSGRAVTGSGTVTITDTILSPGSHGGNNEFSVGCRFLNVTIAQGATINSATFTLRAQATYNAGSNVVRFWVSAQAADNPSTISTTSGNLNTTNRPRTTAVSAAWTQTSVVGDTEYSIDVTSVIQEIVNRAGWASGNAIMILIDTHADTTSGEWQDYYSYNGSTTNAPKLSIDYSTGGGTNHTSSVSGSVTPSATVVKQTSRALTGALTPAAAIV